MPVSKSKFGALRLTPGLRFRSPPPPKDGRTGRRNSSGSGREEVTHTLSIVVPLYIYPATAPDILAPAWQKLVDAAAIPGVHIAAVVNPGNGPGLEWDRGSYSFAMKALHDSGIEVIAYVASGYGKVENVPEHKVTSDIDRYKEWYGEWVSGVFLDEVTCSGDDEPGDGVMSARYDRYYRHAKAVIGPRATVILNTGVMDTCPSLEVGNDSVINYVENSQAFMLKAHGSHNCPPPAPNGMWGRSSFLLHGSTLSTKLIHQWVARLKAGGWSHVYITEQVFNPEKNLWNPWATLTEQWDQLVEAIALEHGGGKIPSPPAKGQELTERRKSEELEGKTPSSMGHPSRSQPSISAPLSTPERQKTTSGGAVRWPRPASMPKLSSAVRPPPPAPAPRPADAVTTTRISTHEFKWASPSASASERAVKGYRGGRGKGGSGRGAA